MLCFRDKTYCSDAERCANKDGCDRYFSQDENDAAIKWWGSEKYPVAFSSFAETCDKFEEQK